VSPISAKGLEDWHLNKVIIIITIIIIIIIILSNISNKNSTNKYFFILPEGLEKFWFINIILGVQFFFIHTPVCIRLSDRATKINSHPSVYKIIWQGYKNQLCSVGAR